LALGAAAVLLARGIPVFAEQGVLESIRFRLIGAGDERVFFQLSGFHPPEVSVVEGGAPQVVCEFANIRAAAGIGSQVEVNGRGIRGLRIDSQNGTQPKLRVAVVLDPKFSYDVEQVFAREDNLFMLVVTPRGVGEAPQPTSPGP
jgi:hypothetical protein